MGIFDFFKPNVEKLKKKRDVEGLIKVLKFEKDKYVRRRAAEALGDIGDIRAVEPLMQAALKDSDLYVANALWEMGGIQIKGSILIPLSELENTISKKTVEALGNIGEPVVEPLIRSLEDGPELQVIAAQALGKIGDARAVEPLIHVLKDENYYVRTCAARALGEIGDTRAVEPLIQLLKDDYWDIRKMAAEALGKIGDTRAVEPLIQLSSWDDDSYVRKAAEKVLETIKIKT